MHVVVVGGGVFGAWTARWLQRRGSRVTLVDQYGPGSSLSSSGDESRVTRSAHGPDAFYPLWQRRALEQWRVLEREAAQQLVVPTGVVWFARRDDGFEAASAATLTGLGIPAERWTVDELEARLPQVDRAGLTWALHEPDGGALLARRGVATVAEAVVAEGGEVVIGRVTSPLATAGGHLRGVRLANGDDIGADAVVFAAGSWLPKLLGPLPGLALEVPRQEVIYFATPPGDGRFDADTLPTWVDYDASFYGIPSIERRGFKIAPDWPGPIVDPDTQDRRLTDACVDAARAYLRIRFPALVDRPVAEGRVCQYEVTTDANFLVDRHPTWANAWIVGGGSGHGFKHGPVIGEYASALVTGDEAAAAELAPPDGRFALGPRSSGAALGLRTAATPPS